MAGKEKNPQLTSPKGTFKYPRLAGDADFRFDKECGEYGVKLLLDPNTKGTTEFLAKLDEATDVAFKQMQEENPKHAKKMLKAPCYKMEEDSEGNETGLIEVGFKMKHKITAKKGPNAGKVFTKKPVLFDSFGKPITADDIKIGGGTVGKVSFEYYPYFAANDKRAGISKRLLAAQIIELHEWNGSRDASTFGFGDEDGGFSVNETKETPAADEEEEEEEETADAKGGDF